ncbi:hypothetical protein HYFRA_00010672 [Hymenoscyphus fraxineus]|uniref:Uncharacterized protein n=1 Tax=Hymenoscyphus fraxineus TaxID=746836 RepID=A0A9N9L8Z9_9HELO|nr:hypothetical protein HYFRA_00010672 [Hymenoscyphus fraxineus]
MWVNNLQAIVSIVNFKCSASYCKARSKKQENLEVVFLLVSNTRTFLAKCFNEAEGCFRAVDVQEKIFHCVTCRMERDIVDEK